MNISITGDDLIRITEILLMGVIVWRIYINDGIRIFRLD